MIEEYKLDWLEKSLEELKYNSYKYPAQIMIKNQYNIDFNNSIICTKNKINAFAIFAIYATKTFVPRLKRKSFSTPWIILKLFQKTAE